MKVMSYLHFVASSLLRSSCSHSSSGLPLSAFVTRVSLSRGVKIIGSIGLLSSCVFFVDSGVIDLSAVTYLKVVWDLLIIGQACDSSGVIFWRASSVP
jgi:hypothetical protein